MITPSLASSETEYCKTAYGFRFNEIKCKEMRRISVIKESRVN